MGEATGLFIAACTWPMWELSAGWRAGRADELEREAIQQTFPDGVNKEQATWYHHAVADMMLVAGLVGRAERDGLQRRRYWQRLQSMFEYLASIMDVGGNVPQIGDADDGLLVRFDPARDFDPFHSLLATGAVLFERAEFKAKAGAVDDKTRWLLGDDADAEFASLAVRSSEISRCPCDASSHRAVTTFSAATSRRLRKCASSPTQGRSVICRSPRTGMPTRSLSR